MIVAIDGPAGAGKSSVARAVAGRLGFTLLDSGALYRCVGLLVLETGREPSDVAAGLEVELDDDRVSVAGRDVTGLIRSAAVSEAASRAAADPAVRDALLGRQRDMLARGDWVAEGRDIGTRVAPGAELKVFLTASPEERARRRAAQTGGDFEQVLAEQRARDERDTSREHAPLAAAADAVHLDTTGLEADEVVTRIAALVEDRRA